jgi:peptidoglycan hydrolase CwlO-like protein
MPSGRVILLLSVATLGVVAPAAADVQSQLNSASQGASRLRGQIQSDNSSIQRYQPRLDDLQQRLSGLQSSLAIQQNQLSEVQGELRGARAKLVHLRVTLAADRTALASQLVAQYKDPTPNLVTVVLNAHGFRDLIETTRSLSNVARHNTEIVQNVGFTERQVAGQAKHLAGLERRQAAQTGAVIAERDQVAAIRETVLEQQSRFVRSRDNARAQLAKVQAQRDRLSKRLSALQAQASGYGGPVPNFTGGFAAHGGSYGFFQAPGTNYSVGDEPRIAARLDALGKALHLHLIGISGYRSPQHSVEVGGFPNDPHTRGEASDTPGVEGVPESTLNRFGLTRPCGGAAEADHIQLVGSI